MLMEQIRFIEDQIKECEEEMSQLLIELDTPIMTVPGVGPILGATILSEIGDINRFDTNHLNLSLTQVLMPLCPNLGNLNPQVRLYPSVVLLIYVEPYFRRLLQLINMILY